MSTVETFTSGFKCGWIQKKGNFPNEDNSAQLKYSELDQYHSNLFLECIHSAAEAKVQRTTLFFFFLLN